VVEHPPVGVERAPRLGGQAEAPGQFGRVLQQLVQGPVVDGGRTGGRRVHAPQQGLAFENPRRQPDLRETGALGAPPDFAREFGSRQDVAQAVQHQVSAKYSDHKRISSMPSWSKRSAALRSEYAFIAQVVVSSLGADSIPRENIR
jgi:hypothetical protein